MPRYQQTKPCSLTSGECMKELRKIKAEIRSIKHEIALMKKETSSEQRFKEFKENMDDFLGKGVSNNEFSEENSLKGKLLFSITQEGDEIDITPLNEDHTIHIKGRKSLWIFIQALIHRNPECRRFLPFCLWAVVSILDCAYVALLRRYTRNA